MRGTRLGTVGAAIALGLAAAPAHADDPLPAGVTSADVEHVRHVPIRGGATSAEVVGKRLYVVGWSTLAIFDVSDPADPKPLSEVPLGFQFPHEDVDTNGRVLVLAETTLAGAPPRPADAVPAVARFHVWDVRDPRNPREVATLASNGDRSLTCVFNCAYAYGASGTILDLADPANPRVVGNWGTGKPAARGFDVTEVAPGRVLTATRPMMLLDARDDPLAPALVATGEDNVRTAHATQWPSGGHDRFMLSSVETFGKPRCDADSGPLITWDAASAAAGTIEIVDELRLSNGTAADGRPVANKLACSAHAFDAHPDFRDGGIVALGHFDHGTRFVRVGPDGRMSEVGWFMPTSGQTFQARWASEEVVYGLDLERGIDVLRYTGSTR
jgi:hypothetical protein